MNQKVSYVFTGIIFILFMVSIQNIHGQEKDSPSDDQLFDLDLEALMNMDIMSASKKVESLFDSPLSSSVITKEELRNSGATSIAEALRLVPGFIVREKTNGNHDVHIRGYENIPPNSKVNYSDNSITLVMIDNRIVYNYFQGGTFWETLPISIYDIERIEVIRGPSSALYGPNAVTGVINILTKKQENKGFSVFADLQAGSLNTKIASASAGYGISDKFGIRLSGNYQYRDRTQNEYYIYRYQQWTSQLDTVQKPIYPNSPVLEPMFEDPTMYFDKPLMASDAYAANAFIYFDPTQDINIEAQFGLQDSKIQTFFVDQGDLPMSMRLSSSNYGALFSKVHNFTARASYLAGEQNLFRGDPNFHYDFNVIDANIEYDYSFKNFSVRPGFSYQQSSYDCTPYIDTSAGEGLFQSEKTLSNLAFHLRTEYSFDRLRLIAAIRADSYNKPNSTYLSWQFVALHKIDNDNMLRFVYSRANRGPFMLDTYTDLAVPIIGDINMVLVGNEELKLLTMDQFEVGFRNKILKNLYSDFEVFYSTTKDYAGVLVDTLTFGVPTYLKYHNLPLKGGQIGFTGSFDFKPTKKLSLKAFATIQRTIFTDYPVAEHSDSILIDYNNKATPVIFGGLIINYSPIEKLNFFANLYYFSQHSYDFLEFQNFAIDEKARIDVKVSYKIWKENAVYINARNVLNSTSREFPFGDQTAGLYLVGLNLSF